MGLPQYIKVPIMDSIEVHVWLWIEWEGV